MLKHTQTFNDGVVKICEIENAAEPGKMPKELLLIKRTLRYKERTVGLKRFYEAKQTNVEVRYVLRCPRLRDVSAQDVAVPIDGKQYRIIQIQYPEDIDPPVMDLTLEELTQYYGIYQQVPEGVPFEVQICQRFYVRAE